MLSRISPHVIYAGVGSAVDFNHVDGVPLRDFDAVGAAIARRAGGALFAVKRLGQNACDCQFSLHRGCLNQVRRYPVPGN